MGSRPTTPTTWRPSGIEGVLDFAIVSALLLIPGSYLLWLNSSEFDAPLWRRVALLSIPGVLVGTRAFLLRHSVRRAYAHWSVVGLYVGILLFGLVNALTRTHYAGNVASIYGQQFYWLGLVALFLRATSARPPEYVLGLVRKYYHVVATAAVLFALLFVAFGEALPHQPLITPNGVQFADNYYLSLIFSDVPRFEIPRFTFLYREPRVLGVYLVIGLALQFAHLVGVHARRDGRATRRAAAGFGLLVAAFFITDSTFAYVVVGGLLLMAVAAVALGRWYWRWLRGLHITALVGAMAVMLVAFLAIERQADPDLVVRPFIEEISITDEEESATKIISKPAGLVGEYAIAYLRAPRPLFLFPLGTGTMNLDSDRFREAYGVETAGGSRLGEGFAQHAGVIGVLVLIVIVWRLLTIIQYVARVRPEPSIRVVCFLGVFLLLSSVLIIDMVSTALGFLFYGLIVRTDDETRRLARRRRWRRRARALEPRRAGG
jgi:hypothetical protein